MDRLLEPLRVAPPPGTWIDPLRFRSLGPLPEAPLVLDTDSLEAAGGHGRRLRPAPGLPEVAVFTFDGGRWSPHLTVRGSCPAVLLFQGPTRLGGRIDAGAAGARPAGPGGGGWPGGGGGFAGQGGASGGDGSGGASAGVSAGFLPGSGGQSGAAVGGLGGGALQIGCVGRLDLRGAHVSVDGCPGRDADLRGSGTAGGGGSGGQLVLHGREVRLDPYTCLSAAGGRGGDAGPAGAGGGGGGGGLILGITHSRGAFQPAGAVFDVFGGRGGAGGRPGEAGGTGIVFLSGVGPRVGRRRWRPAWLTPR